MEIKPTSVVVIPDFDVVVVGVVIAVAASDLLTKALLGIAVIVV